MFVGVAALVAGCTGILGTFEVSNTPTTGPDASDDALPGNGTSPDASTADGETEAGTDAGPPPTGAFRSTALANIVGLRDGITTVDKAGNIYVAANITSTLTIRGVVHTPPPTGVSLLLVKLDPSGNVVWSVDYDSDQYLYANGLAADANGNLYLAGSMQGDSVNFGSAYPNLANPHSGSLAGIIASFNGTDGSTRWVKMPDTNLTGDDQCYAISTRGSSDTVAVTCTYSNVVRLEPTSGNYINFNAKGAGDAFVALLDTGSGRAVWASPVSGDAFERVTSLARDTKGDIYVQGASTSPNVSDGNQTLNKPFTGTGAYGFVLKFDRTTHAVVFGKAFGNKDGNVEGGQVAVFKDGTIASCMNWYGTVDFGKGAITSVGTASNSQDAVVVGFAGSGAGATQWVVPWGGAFYESCQSIVADDENYAVLGGFRDSSDVTFADKPLANPPPRSGAGSRAGDVVKIDSNGKVQWAYTVTTSTDTGSTNVVNTVSTVPGTNDVVYAGHFNGHVDLGSGTKTTSENDGGVNSFFVTVRSR